MSDEPTLDPARLEHTMKRVAAFIRKRHPGQRSSAFKKAVLRGLGKLLPPHWGRPKDPELDEAERLRAEGLTFGQIARQLRPEYETWTGPQRFEYRTRLMKGVSNRTRRRRVLQSASALQPSAKSQLNEVAFDKVGGNPHSGHEGENA
jgi:hypothetical protein